MHADFAVRPVMQGLPVEPVPLFEATKDLLQFLLAGISAHHPLGRPIPMVGQQQRAAQARGDQLLQSGMIDLEGQARSSIGCG